MQIVDMAVKDIRPYANNPRDNKLAIEKVAESIKAYGFQQPIVVDRDGVIIVGHTRYAAAQELGLETVPCIVADGLTDKQAKAYRIADNKTADFSIWDNKKLLEELDEIPDDLFTGFADGELFDEVLPLNSSIEMTDCGETYEVVFRSGDMSKIEKIKAVWEDMGGDDE